MTTRITLDIDNDLLEAAQFTADHTGESLGKIISRLAWRTINTPAVEGTYEPLLGIVILPRRPDSPPITMEFVNQLRDELDEY
jgi:hypothetical protein